MNKLKKSLKLIVLLLFSIIVFNNSNYVLAYNLKTKIEYVKDPANPTDEQYFFTQVVQRWSGRPQTNGWEAADPKLDASNPVYDVIGTYGSYNYRAKSFHLGPVTAYPESASYTRDEKYHYVNIFYDKSDAIFDNGCDPDSFAYTGGKAVINTDPAANKEIDLVIPKGYNIKNNDIIAVYVFEEKVNQHHTYNRYKITGPTVDALIENVGADILMGLKAPEYLYFSSENATQRGSSQYRQCMDTAWKLYSVMGRLGCGSGWGPGNYGMLDWNRYVRSNAFKC